MFAAPADSRSLTFSSLAASFASVAPCRYFRCPCSVKVARHGSPSVSGGYTRIPNSSSITGRAESTAGCKLTMTAPSPAAGRPGYREGGEGRRDGSS